MDATYLDSLVLALDTQTKWLLITKNVHKVDICVDCERFREVLVLSS